MKNALSVFDLKQQRNIQIKIKKSIKTNSKSKVSNLIFKFIQKLYLELFDFALYPAAGTPYIWGLLYCALYPAHERLSILQKNVRSFHALKFRTLTCESAYLFIMLHKHSI